MDFKEILDAYCAKYNRDMGTAITEDKIAKTKDLLRDYKNVLCQARAEMSPVDYERYYNKYCLMSSCYNNGIRV